MEMDQQPMFVGGTPGGQSPLVISWDALAGDSRQGGRNLGSNISEIREPFLCQSWCGGRRDELGQPQGSAWGDNAGWEGALRVGDSTDHRRLLLRAAQLSPPVTVSPEVVTCSGKTCHPLWHSGKGPRACCQLGGGGGGHDILQNPCGSFAGAQSARLGTGKICLRSKAALAPILQEHLYIKPPRSSLVVLRVVGVLSCPGMLWAPSRGHSA